MNYKKTILRNGLRILLLPMKGTQAVTVLVLVATGSKYETKKINGLSHLLEHMFFKGTKKRPNTLAIAEELDRVGGQYNAFTGKEYTGYYAKVEHQHLDLALDIVSDIFLNSLLNNQEMAKEKRVIIEEIKMYQDTPMRYIGELWEELLYGDQPAGWPIAGTIKTVSDLQQKQVFDYLKKYYSSANTLVCLAGKIDQLDVLRQIKKYFQSISVGQGIAKKSVQEQQSDAQALIHYKKTDQTHFCLGVRAYDIFHPQRYALSLLAMILGGFMSSRLWISVRERQALAYYVKTEVQTYTDSGYLVTQAGVDHQNVAAALKTILEGYKEVKAKGVTQEELTKAKEHIKGSLALELESSDEVASWLGGQEILKKEILTPQELLKKIEQVSLDDIQQVAQNIFKAEKLNLALIGPFKSDKFKKFLKI